MKTVRINRRMMVGTLLVALCCVAGGCREEEQVTSSEEETVAPPQEENTVKGLFLLNEGNMGSNSCTLDYFDYATGVYSRNIFAERNPGVAMELGDVGSDIGVYGEKLYAVLNSSNLVEVMDARTAQHLGSVDVTNGRYVIFHGGKAYVSSYAGPIQTGSNVALGKVVEIDTLSLEITREAVVGYQPEEMVVTDGKLYVANSGGYLYPDYDHTVSVIDLETFQVTNTIDVAINLQRMEIDRFGRIYVSSQGNYYDIKSDVFVIDSQTDQVTGSLGVAANEMCLCGDSLYITSTEWSYVTGGNTVAYTLYDVQKREVVSDCFITDGTESQITMPYGVAVNPDTREIFVTDAGDYVTPGYLYRFSPEGKLQWKVRAGNVPAHMAFTTQALYSVD